LGTVKTGFPLRIRHSDVTSTRSIPQTMCCCLSFPSMSYMLTQL